MFGKMKTAAKYFLIGLGIGLLTAPRSGQQTRDMLVDRITSLTGMTKGLEGSREEMTASRPETATTGLGQGEKTSSEQPFLGP